MLVSYSADIYKIESQNHNCDRENPFPRHCAAKHKLAVSHSLLPSVGNSSFVP